MESGVYFAVLSVLAAWTLFWAVRLAVRYGTSDALRMNRQWLASQHEQRNP